VKENIKSSFPKVPLTVFKASPVSRYPSSKGIFMYLAVRFAI
jgi:hypothetical protein